MREAGEDNITLDEQMILGIEVMVSIETEPQINADERRLITSAIRIGREKRDVQRQQLDFFIKKHQLRRTWIGRIFTDNLIRGHPRHPRNPCSITFSLEGKSSYQWSFSLITW
ncbi:MAG: hypothetical protein KKA10_08685 [Euryarchaeota archaeon]|nr:hypothetical protein [Euryarchaeota archaeon]MCG2736218.1 hypothetical protein [Candidatus Methanoperedenaceae archaeon]